MWHDEPVAEHRRARDRPPAAADVIYCGTGEANLSADSHPGVGLYRSLNAGQSWQLLALADTAGPAPAHRRAGGRPVRLRPPAGRRRRATGTAAPTGLFRSTDGGVTWARVPLIGVSPFRCHDVRFHPHRPGRGLRHDLGARHPATGSGARPTAGPAGSSSAVGLPPPDQIGRTLAGAGAVGPGRPVRADGARRPSEQGAGACSAAPTAGTPGTSIGGQHFANERQMSYNNTIVVHPTDPDHVLCGGVDLHRTTDAGADLEPGDQVERPTAAPRTTPTPTTTPCSCPRPGPAGSTTSTTAAWTSATTAARPGRTAATGWPPTCSTTSPSPRPTAGSSPAGPRTTARSSPPTAAGHLVRVDRRRRRLGGHRPRPNVNHIYSTAQGMSDLPAPAGTGRSADVSPPETDDVKEALDGVRGHGRATTPGRVFTGSTRVWRTRDDADTWKPVSEVLDGSADHRPRGRPGRQQPHLRRHRERRRSSAAPTAGPPGAATWPAPCCRADDHAAREPARRRRRGVRDRGQLRQPARLPVRGRGRSPGPTSTAASCPTCRSIRSRCRRRILRGCTSAATPGSSSPRTRAPPGPT